MNQMISKLKQKANMYAELKKQRGMTLLEIIIVLGIIGVMAAGVVILAQRAFAAQDVTDIVTNTNTVRTTAVDTFSNDGQYPVFTSALTLNNDTIKTGTNKSMASQMVRMGKISPSEVRNGISGDYFAMAGVPITATAEGGTAAPRKGFVVLVNGLDQGQCRNVLSQVANEWDYVQVESGAAGVDPAIPAALNGTVAALTTQSDAAILKTFDSSATVTSESIAFVCGNNSNNTLVLGSR